MMGASSTTEHVMEFLHSLDLGTLFWFGSVHQPWLDVVMENATNLGSTRVLYAVALIAAVGFAIARRFRPALLLAVIGPASYYFSETVKSYVARPRPDVVWRKVDLPSSPSFPSGHALCSMAVYPAVAFTAARRLRRRGLAVVLIAAAVALAMLIGATRMYLGVHYLTDVVGGWTAGLALALLVVWVDGIWDERKHLLPALAPEIGEQRRLPSDQIKKGVESPR
jgi:undecaprenyl-diphosphatase